MDGIRPPVSRVRLILLALLASSPAAAQPDAPSPAPAPTAPSGDDTDTDELPARPAPVEAAPVTPAARIPITGYELTGQRIDPDERLIALLASIAPVGEDRVCSIAVETKRLPIRSTVWLCPGAAIGGVKGRVSAVFGAVDDAWIWTRLR